MKSPSTPPPARAPWRADVEVAARTQARGFDAEAQLSRLRRTLAAGAVVGAASAVRAVGEAEVAQASSAPPATTASPATAAGVPVWQGLFGKLVIGLAVIGAVAVGIDRLRADPAGTAATEPAGATLVAGMPAAVAPAEAPLPAPETPLPAADAPSRPSPPDREPRAASAAIARPASGPASPPPPADPAASSAAASEKDSAGTVAEETAHLAELRASAGDPARALTLAQEGDRRFPRGIFGVEREVIAIGALARLGRSGEARQRAEAFLARHPNSPFVARVRAAAGIDAPAAGAVTQPGQTASGGATDHAQP